MMYGEKKIREFGRIAFERSGSNSETFIKRQVHKKCRAQKRKLIHNIMSGDTESYDDRVEVLHKNQYWDSAWPNTKVMLSHADKHLGEGFSDREKAQYMNAKMRKARASLDRIKFSRYFWRRSRYKANPLNIRKWHKSKRFLRAIVTFVDLQWENKELLKQLQQLDHACVLHWTKVKKQDHFEYKVIGATQPPTFDVYDFDSFLEWLDLLVKSNHYKTVKCKYKKVMRLRNAFTPDDDYFTRPVLEEVKVKTQSRPDAHSEWFRSFRYNLDKYARKEIFDLFYQTSEY